MAVDPGPPPAAVVLAGGTGERLGGVDKASLTYAGDTLLDRVLGVLSGVEQVVVVGPARPVTRAVRFVSESPARGGPAAGLLAGVDALVGDPATVAVVAVDMPRVTAATVARMAAAARGAGARAGSPDGSPDGPPDGPPDGAVLVGRDGRRQVAAVLRRAALRGADPGPGRRTGLPLHRLLQGLHLVEVEAEADEALDVDTEADLVALRGGPETNEGGPVNLHDWIDELMDVLDVDTEVDEALVLDLARDAAHQVERRAAPVTTYLLGFAAGQQDADPRAIEALAARATALAGEWDRPADAKDPDEVDDEVPDDSRVDHTDDRYEDD